MEGLVKFQHRNASPKTKTSMSLRQSWWRTWERRLSALLWRSSRTKFTVCPTTSFEVLNSPLKIFKTRILYEQSQVFWRLSQRYWLLPVLHSSARSHSFLPFGTFSDFSQKNFKNFPKKHNERNDELKLISGGVDLSELKPAFAQLLSKYERIFMPRPEFFDAQPIIASKISVKPELQQKSFVSLHHAPYDFSRYTNGQQNQNLVKPAVNFNENKSSAVNYKNYGVAGFNSVSAAQGIQSKHYNYPKSSNSILNVGQFNYIRYPSNNNI